MAKQIYFINIVILNILIFFSAGVNNKPILNIPRILLPYNQGIPTNYSLDVSGLNISDTCYVWSSSHPHLVSLTPLCIDPESCCSTKSTVSAISYSPVRQIISIIAEDKKTEERLYCDVVIDAINSIEIGMTTHELYLDGVPELFYIIAKNKQGHIFSNLSGIEFEWNIINDENLPNATVNVLRFVNLSESLYQVPPFLQFWESKGKQGSSVLIAGVETGNGKLRAKIKNTSYKYVNTYQVTLTVLPNIRLNPVHDIYLLPYSSVHYKVDVMKHGKIEEVALPSDQYYLKLNETKFATLDSHSGNVTALKVGHSTIFLSSITNVIASSFPLSSAEIHIVNPSYMMLHVFPGQNWALKELSNYIISVKLYDVRHHQIYQSDNIKVQVSFPSRFFYVNYSSPNGTYHFVRTVVPGSGKIKAELIGLLKQDNLLFKWQQSVKVQQDFVIYQRVQVTPSFVLLPWDPLHQFHYKIHMKAVGGTGFYNWMSSNSSIAVVASPSKELSREAVVNIKADGNFIITAFDMYNSDFSHSSKISVQVVANFDIIPTLVETELSNDLIIPVVFHGYEDNEKKRYRVFDDCSRIAVVVDIVEKARFSYIEDAEVPPFGRGCQNLQFKCNSVGYSRVFISHGHGDGALKTTAVIACHKSLRPIHPVRVAVVALGSGKEVAFEGGPRAWPMNTKGHYMKLNAKHPSLVNITRLYDRFRYNRDLHVYRVVCKQLGETILTFNIGNDASPTNPNPAKCETSVRFVCAHPETVHLRPVLKTLKVNQTYLYSHSIIKIPIVNIKTFEVDLWFKDKVGRKFSNITSFDVLWELSDYTLAKPKSHRDFITTVDGANSYNKVSRTYQVFEVTGKSGHLNITAKVVGYRNDVLKQQDIKIQVDLPSMVTSFTQVEFVDSMPQKEIHKFAHSKIHEDL